MCQGVWAADSVSSDYVAWQHKSGRFITTSAEVTPKGSLVRVRESYPTWPQIQVKDLQ